jgi:pathogenesis-related protein 1
MRLRLRTHFALLAFAGCLAPSLLAQEFRARPASPSVTAPVYTGPPVKIRVFNYTGQGVEMVWMNPSGPPQSSGLLPPMLPGGAPAVIDTFGGHLWLFKSGGQVIQFLAASNQPVQDVPIGQPQILQSPAPEAAAMQLREKRGLILQEPIPIPDLVSPPTGPGAATEIDGVPIEVVEFLRIHNEERARLGVPPLRWSALLARYAQKWAEHLASTGLFEHRERDLGSPGESLFRGPGDHTPGHAARRWLEEREVYRGGPITTENRPVVGHYTQMIWRDTTEVGYGLARGTKGIVIVANYAPYGNRTGLRPY